MAINHNEKFNNKPLVEYRTKLRGRKEFLNRYFGFHWMQTPSKSDIIISSVFWLIGVSVGLYTKFPLDKIDMKPNQSIIDLFLVGATISMLTMWIAYWRGTRHQK